MQQETDDHQTQFSTPEIHASNRRKMSERVVVAVKIQENDKGSTRKHHRSELGPPPSDCWSWRKYGQKPIKGSPYPRGYYRCSTSKGCSAKKQVERCKTDASVLIITYTSSHNHPGLDHAFPLKDQKQQIQTDDHTITAPKQEQETVKKPRLNDEDHFHYSQSQFSASTPDDTVVVNVSEQDHHHNAFAEKLETPSVHHNEDVNKPTRSCDLKTLHVEPVENDFYDELEELPTSSFFTAFMRKGFCSEERVLVNP